MSASSQCETASSVPGIVVHCGGDWQTIFPGGRISYTNACITPFRLHRSLPGSMFLTSSTLASVRFFAVAARLLSFKKAAIELHVTQGAVSQHIKQLEDALGCKLFFRLPRQIMLTEEGRQFALAVERSLDEIERAAAAIGTARKTASIRVRAGPSFALRWLVPRLGDFYARHENISLFVAAAYGYFDPAHREFDLAIELIKGKLPQLQSEVLMDEYLVPVCSPVFLAKHEFLKKPGDLSRCTLLHDAHAWTGAEPHSEWRHWLRAVGAETVDCTQGQLFSLAHMSIEAALTHQGVAMGRTALIRELLDTGRLVMPFNRPVKSPMKYCLLYPKELAVRREIQVVIRWLHEQAGTASSRERWFRGAPAKML
jgi:LysR family transcriptional regulator, glycine cleavage system transcriptional activator